jgi:hypothetical protein
MSVEMDELGFEAPVPLGHPARLGLLEYSGTGPAVGDLLPDFKLPDQNGQSVSFRQDSRGSRSVVIFYRSAVW